MQLGARWSVGNAPHPGVPELLHAAITQAEVRQPEGETWTLTWLEGRARVELLTASRTVCADLRIDPAGNIVAGSPAPAFATEADTDDDDDDWLN